MAKKQKKNKKKSLWEKVGLNDAALALDNAPYSPAAPITTPAATLGSDPIGNSDVGLPSKPFLDLTDDPLYPTLTGEDPMWNQGYGSLNSHLNPGLSPSRGAPKPMAKPGFTQPRQEKRVGQEPEATDTIDVPKEEVKKALENLEGTGFMPDDQLDVLKGELDNLQSAFMPVNLHSLAKVMDSDFGTNIAGGFAPIDTIRGRLSRIGKAQGGIADYKDKLADNLRADNYYGLQQKQLERNLTNDFYKRLKDVTDRRFEYEKLDRDERLRKSLQKMKSASNVKAASLRGGSPYSFKQGRQALATRQAFEKSADYKRASGMNLFLSLLTTYQMSLQKLGPQAFGAGSRELEQAWTVLALKFKTAEELGAVTGPDLGLMEGAIERAGGLGAYMTSLVSGGKAGANDRLNKLRQIYLSQYNQHRTTLEGSAGSEAYIVQSSIDALDKNHIAARQSPSERRAEHARQQRLKGYKKKTPKEIEDEINRLRKKRDGG